MTIIIIIFVIASIFASVLVISACILSSRMSRQENLVEEYMEVEAPTQATPQPYTVKS